MTRQDTRLQSKLKQWGSRGFGFAYVFRQDHARWEGGSERVFVHADSLCRHLRPHANTVDGSELKDQVVFLAEPFRNQHGWKTASAVCQACFDEESEKVHISRKEALNALRTAPSILNGVPFTPPGATAPLIFREGRECDSPIMTEFWNAAVEAVQGGASVPEAIEVAIDAASDKYRALQGTLGAMIRAM